MEAARPHEATALVACARVHPSSCVSAIAVASILLPNNGR